MKTQFRESAYKSSRWAAFIRADSIILKITPMPEHRRAISYKVELKKVVSLTFDTTFFICVLILQFPTAMQTFRISFINILILFIALRTSP